MKQMSLQPLPWQLSDLRDTCNFAARSTGQQEIGLWTEGRFRSLYRKARVTADV